MPFDHGFTPDADVQPRADDPSELESLAPVAEGMLPFMLKRAGTSYNGGLYRLHRMAEMAHWTRLVEKAFPSLRGCVYAFASDWLGRQYALDFSRRLGSQCGVLRACPGTGETHNINATFLDFHQRELIEHKEQWLEAAMAEAWLGAHGQGMSRAQCAGYTLPRFMGGAHTPDNLEVTDMESYWDLCAHLLSKQRERRG